MAPVEPRIVFSASQVAELISSLAADIMAFRPRLARPALVGIRTGGEVLAQRLAQAMASRPEGRPELGVMDITLYRDDWTRLHQRPKVGKTDIPFSLEDRNVVLVDDVLFTGRTVRAALDALVDLGRPARIKLAVLVDRGHRELPIHTDFVGARLDTTYDQLVDVELGSNPADDRVLLRDR